MYQLNLKNIKRSLNDSINFKYRVSLQNSWQNNWSSWRIFCGIDSDNVNESHDVISPTYLAGYINISCEIIDVYMPETCQINKCSKFLE
jgi:hypothetical protein